MTNKIKEFLEELSLLMEKYKAEFEIYEEFIGDNNVNTVLDLEIGEPLEGTYGYTKIPMRFINTESIRGFIKRSYDEGD